MQWATSWPWGHLFTPGPNPTLVGLFYAILAVATVALASRWTTPVVRRWWSAAVVCGASLAVGPLVPSRPEVAEADVCAVGHGLAVAIRSPAGPVALYDAGKMSDPHVGRRIIAPSLWSFGVRRIDVLILSHADADHFNGVLDLLDRFAVGSVRIPPGFEGAKNPGAARLIAEIRTRGIPAASIAEGDVIDLGLGLTLTAIHPRADDVTGSDNARSVVLEVANNGQKLLLTGDLEQSGLVNLLGRPVPEPSIDAILAPHHGGRTSNPPLLYQWARPRIIAVSQRTPTAGSRDPLAFLDTPGKSIAPLLRTWKSGAIQFRWTDQGLAATGFLDPVDPQTLSEAPILASIPLIPTLVARWPLALLVTLLGLAAGVGLSLVVVAVEWGAWSLVAPGRRLKPPPPPEGPSQPKRITTRASDGSVLVGDWFPSGRSAGSDRTIVLLHGLAEDRRAFEVRVGQLTAHGWNVAAVDARASGESGGRWVTFGGREANDLGAWLDTLISLHAEGSLLSPRFAAWGRSMGAATALRASASDPRLMALVLEAPFDDLRAAVATVLRKMRVPGALSPLVLARARWLAGVSLDRPRPLDLAPRVAAATLVVHGSNDPLVPVTRARALAERIGGDHGRAARFLEVPGARHADVFEIGGDDLALAVVAFLDRAVPDG